MEFNLPGDQVTMSDEEQEKEPVEEKDEEEESSVSSEGEAMIC